MKKKGALILGGILSFFLAIIFTLKHCSHPKFVPLPDFGKIELDQSSYIDENGISFPSEDLKGKILLVNYLSVDCPQSCPLKFNLFKFYIYDQLVENEGFKDVCILSVFLDDHQDLSEKIKDFRSHNNISSKKWKFLIAKEHPFFNVELENGNPLHTKDTVYGFEKNAHVMTLLIDKDFNVRGKYLTPGISKKPGEEPFNPHHAGPEIRRITKEISLLIHEENQ